MPDASFETTQPKPEKSTTPVSPKNTGTTFDGGTGVLNPIPKELASDQSTGTPATPVSSKNTSTSFDGGAGILNPIPKELASGQATDAPATQAPVKNSSPAVDSGQRASTPADPAADVMPRAPVRGTQVAADRALTEAPLTDREKREISFAQKDKSLIPVAERVMSHIKSLGGQNTGLPMFEVNYKDKTTGDVSSKRVAPYKTKTNVDGSINVFAVDLDRPLFVAKKLFDWTADKGKPDRFGYTGVNDSAFTKDLGTYLKNQAESRRGSGKPLMIDGKPSTASGQPTETLTRDQELFFSTIMAQKIPDVLTTQSIGAISRIRKTAAASGVDVTTNKLGAVEPNSLREQLVKEGAPIHELYNTDPKTGRVQSNTTGRNSVLMQMKLDGFKSFEPTGQHISQPNSAAIEASFMPAATPEDFTGKSVGGILAKKDWTIFSAENPANKALSASENAQRNATLESELTSAGYTVTRVKGKYNRDENSLLVTGISGEKAREFGAKHGQESILTNKGIEYMNGDLEPATGVDVHTEKPSDFFTTLPDGTHFTVNLGDKISADSIEGQTAKADATIDDTAKSAAPALSYMPAAKGSLANEQVKTKDVQYKRSTPLEGAVGGVLDVVHFSSKDLSTIDPKESFGKGAATAADQRGNPKAFFYKKGTSYEYDIMHRGEVYSAKIDGNSIYDLNADALDLHQKFSNNYAKMDAAIREAGFAGYSANGSAFDSVSMYDPVKLKSVRPEDVMSRRQLQDSGRKEVSPQETGELDKLDARTGQVTTQQEKLVADNKAALLGSPKYEAAGKRIAAEVGDSYSYEYRSKLDDWADEQAQKMSQKANDGADAKTKASYAAHEAKWTAKDQNSGPSFMPGNSDEGRISTRNPSGGRATENPLTEDLTADIAAMKKTPELLRTNAKLISKYPAMNLSTVSPDKIVAKLKDLAESNLTFLHDQTPEPIRERSKLWYDGGHRIAKDMSSQYKTTTEGSAGVIAALSPQKDWYMNVDLAARVYRNLGELKGSKVQKDHVEWLASKLAGDTTANGVKRALLEGLEGSEFSELPRLQQAMLLRANDELYHDRDYRLVTPEGDFGDFVRNTSGTKAKVAWGDFGSIAKAVGIAKDSSRKNISASLGFQHKVRNFFNNLAFPDSTKGDVTIDTHAVAAALLSPLSGSSTEVLHNFGGSGASGSSLTGISGTYPIYADAYRETAKKLGLLPRELQSITWEAARGLFTDTFKTPENANKTASIWKRYAAKELSIGEAQSQISALAGGIRPPSWYAAK